MVKNKFNPSNASVFSNIASLFQKCYETSNDDITRSSSDLD